MNWEELKQNPTYYHALFRFMCMAGNIFEMISSNIERDLIFKDLIKSLRSDYKNTIKKWDKKNEKYK